MGIIFSILVPIVGGLILYAITRSAVRAPGLRLNQKFVSLGKLQGKTYSEIVSVVGNPSATSAVGDGNTLKQWQATGYHIALIFDSNDICLGITSEISV